LPPATATLLTGASHLEQYSADHYSVIPTVGTLFILNFASSVVVAATLFAPVGRLTRRFESTVLVLASIVGIGIAAGSLAGLVVSETRGLFGFMETGLRGAIVLSIAFEVVALTLLTGYVSAIALSHIKAGVRVRTADR
jgi:hypothetical protein